MYLSRKLPIPFHLLVVLQLSSCAGDRSAYQQLNDDLAISKRTLSEDAGFDSNFKTCNDALDRLHEFLREYPRREFAPHITSAIAEWQGLKQSYTVRFDSLCQHLYHMLYSAYSARSFTRLDRFLDYWHADSTLQPLPNTETLSDTVKAVYDLFNAFLERVSFTESRFIVLPNSMPFTIVDSLVQPNGFHKALATVLLQDTVVNFRPTYAQGDRRVLYLSGAYAVALKRFLITWQGAPRHSLASRIAESDRRARFLRNRIPVLREHSGTFYYLTSQRMVTSVRFSPDLTTAELSEAYGNYRGAYLLYIRTDQGWCYDHPTRIWIQ